MSLNANAKASAKKQTIRVLDDPSTEARAWLTDVSRRAKLIGATHSMKMEWFPIDEVDIQEDDEAKDTQSSGNSSSSVHASSVEKPRLSRKQPAPPSTPSGKMGGGLKREKAESQRDINDGERTVQSAPSAQDMQMMEMLRAMQKMQAQIATIQNDQTDSNVQSSADVRPRLDGLREEWVVNQMIAEAVANHKVWCHPVTRKRESDAQADARMILNEMIVTSLRKFPIFYKGVVDGDNWRIIKNVLMYGAPNSYAMILELKDKLTVHRKTKEVSYPKHEETLRDMFGQLSNLKV